jgi:cell division protein FtsA
MPKRTSPIVGLDIGTTLVRVVMAEAIDGQLEVVGIGESESRGLRKGVISRPDLAVEAVKRTVEAAERMSGLRAETAYVALAGSQIKSYNSQGMIAIPGRHREITREDVQRVIDTACAGSIPSGREVADVLPQEFTVDDQDGIDDPIGMLGSRLSVSVHIVTSPVAAKQNVVSSVNRSGLEVSDIVLAQLAAAESVLSEEDREFGSALVDIGGETTSLAIYQRGAVWHTAVFPLGGSHFTNDIAFGLRTPIPEAERIKREYGCAHRSLMGNDKAAETIEVPSVGGRAPRSLSRQILCDILEPRAEEMLSCVQEEIRRAGFERQLSSGVVLTGSGSLLAGLVEVAEQVFDAPVRLGVPEGFGGPADEVAQSGFATAVGLAMYGLRCSRPNAPIGRGQMRRTSGQSVAERVRTWLGMF